MTQDIKDIEEEMGNIRPKHYIVTKYWLTYYSSGNCTLCGNSGVIDTTNVRFGRRNYCICPNGQELRVAGAKLENNYE